MDQKDDAETRKSTWLKMATELEIGGTPKEKISQTITNAVTEKMREKVKQSGGDPSSVRFNNTWYFMIMTQNGYTDSTKAHNKVDTDKYQKVNSGINSEFINAIRDIRQTCYILEEGFRKLKDGKGNQIVIADTLPKKTVDEFLSDMKAIAKIARDAANNKPKIPTNTHHIWKMCLRLESGLLNVSKLYFQTKLKMINDGLIKFIDEKQAYKFSKGEEPNMLEVLKPKSRDLAIFLGYYGLACPDCGSWRTKESVDADRNSDAKCLECETKFAGRTITSCPSCHILLYAEVLRNVIANKNKCTGCNDELNLPPELLKRALKH